MVKPKNYHTFLFLFGAILWFVGTWHGGWQDVAQSNFEKFTDFFGVILMFWGIFGDLIYGIEIHKHHHTDVKLSDKASQELVDKAQK